MSERYLAHYGILGMHWGVRRFQPYSVRGRKSGEGGREIGLAKKRSKNSPPSHEELIKSTSASEVYRNRDKLTDRELRERVNRIQTEQQLKDLVAKENEKKKKGQSIASNILGRIGTMTAAAIAGAVFKVALEPKIKEGKEAATAIINDPAMLSNFLDFIVGKGQYTNAFR